MIAVKIDYENLFRFTIVERSSFDCAPNHIRIMHFMNY